MNIKVIVTQEQIEGLMELLRDHPCYEYGIADEAFDEAYRIWQGISGEVKKAAALGYYEIEVVAK